MKSTSQIFAIVAQKNGVPVSEVEAVHAANLSYMKYLRNQTDTCAIYIKNLGKLYARFNYYRDMAMIAEERDYKSLEVKKAKVAKMLEHRQKRLDVGSFYGNLHFAPIWIWKFIHKGGTWRDIENNQNNCEVDEGDK